MARSIKQKDINLIQALDRKKTTTQSETASVLRLPIIILVLVVALLCLAYWYLNTMTNELEEQRETLSGYVNDPATQEAFVASQYAQNEAIRMITEKSELEEILLNISSYPELNGGNFATIYEYAGSRVEITAVSYNGHSGVLSFNANCDTVTGVPIFVAQLRMTGIFSDVRYEGYSEQIETSAGTPKVTGYNEDGSAITEPTTIETKSYRFAVTALANAPEAHLP